MKNFLWQWIKSNRLMLLNAASMIGTTAVTSLLGFVYWWVAARQYSPEAVGLSSAAISAMTLLGTICMLGLGTLLISELPHYKGLEASLIVTALLVVSGVGAVAGVLFVLLAPLIAPNFSPLRDTIFDALLFSCGVSLTAVTLVFDQSLLGLLRGDIQLIRNSMFAFLKLVALFLTGLWITHKTGMSIYATWLVGIAFSLLFLVPLLFPLLRRSKQSLWPKWLLLRHLRTGAFEHHALNLTLQVPSLTLPVIVTALLSTRANAWFYVSWMLAGLASLLPSVLATVLFAATSTEPAALAQKARMTLAISALVCVSVCAVLLLGTQYILGLFGHVYAEQATWSLRILALGSLPRIIKDHYIAICRIRRQVRRSVTPMIVGSLLELGLAALGAHFGSLLGLSLGWLLALCIEAVFGFNTVIKTVWIDTRNTSVQVRAVAK